MPIALGQSWNLTLMLAIGAQQGLQAKAGGCSQVCSFSRARGGSALEYPHAVGLHLAVVATGQVVRSGVCPRWVLLAD